MAIRIASANRRITEVLPALLTKIANASDLYALQAVLNDVNDNSDGIENLYAVDNSIWGLSAHDMTPATLEDARNVVTKQHAAVITALQTYLANQN